MPAAFLGPLPDSRDWQAEGHLDLEIEAGVDLEAATRNYLEDVVEAYIGGKIMAFRDDTRPTAGIRDQPLLTQRLAIRPR